jgi:hypothetical protein
MREILAYWRRPVEKIEVYRYHLEKVGHSLLIGALLTACGIPSFYAVVLAVVGYLLIGKCLVDSRPSLDWIADLNIGAFAIAAERLLAGDGFGLTAALVLWVCYCGIVLWRRWASP